MIRRSLFSLCAIAIVVVFHFPDTTLHAGQEQQQPLANNAVSITNSLQETGVGTGRDQAKTEDIETAPEGDNSSPSNVANESRSLGTPNGMFSNKPVETGETSDESFLTRLDPRKNEFLPGTSADTASSFSSESSRKARTTKGPGNATGTFTKSSCSPPRPSD